MLPHVLWGVNLKLVQFTFRYSINTLILFIREYTQLVHEYTQLVHEYTQLVHTRSYDYLSMNNELML